MARLGVEYEVDFENTEKQGGGGILPHMYARIWAEAINIAETKDGKGHQAEITFEVCQPEEFKGRKFWAYWTIVHSDGFNYGQYKYGKPMFDRFARAVDVNVTADTDTDELLFKEFVVEIGIQEGGPNKQKPGEFYKDKNQIDRFFYEDDQAKEPVPELGVIGDGTAKRSAKPAARTAANDNQAPSTASKDPAKTAAAGGARTPWGPKK